MSNLPPGVSSNEYQITGPDREWDEEVECRITSLDVLTISAYGVKQIENAIVRMAVEAERPGLNVALRYLQNAVADIQHVEVDDAACPFTGTVTLQQYDGAIWWECPLCRFVHERQVKAAEVETARKWDLHRDETEWRDA